MKKFAAVLWLFLVSCCLPSAPAAAAPAGVGWERMQADVSQGWSRSYPREKVLALEKKGVAEYKHEYGGSETTTFGSASFSDDWSLSWTESSRTTEKPKGFFLRQLVLVTVERPNQTRARYTVAAIYKENNGQWEFSEIATRADLVEELGGGAGVVPPPAAAVATELFLQRAQQKCVPDYAMKSASLLSEPSLGRSGKRIWYSYRVALEGTARDGRPARCEVTDVAWLRWNAEKKQWEVDSSFDCYARDCKVEE